MPNRQQPDDLGDVVDYIDRAVPEMVRTAVAESVQSAVRDGVVAAIREIANDHELAQTFWRGGFEQLANHAGNASSQWIGRRILTAFIAAAATAGIVWLVKSGAIGK